MAKGFDPNVKRASSKKRRSGSKAYITSLRNGLLVGALGEAATTVANQGDPFAGLPPTITQEEYIGSIQKNWELFAAFGYESYLHSGKGLVVYDYSTLCESFYTAEETERALLANECGTFYLSAEMSRQFHGRTLDESAFPVELQRKVDRYDPERSIVLGIPFVDAGELKLGGQTIAMAHITPREAYEKLGARLDEFATFAINRRNSS